MIYIKKFKDKNKALIFFMFLIIFFIILSIWYFNKSDEEEKLVISKNIKEVVTINEINIGFYSNERINNIDAIIINNESVREISNLVYNGLFEYNEDNILESKLIQDYAEIDEKNYVFKLKDNVKFHNGKNLVSKDVKNTIEQIYLNQESYYSECVDNIQSVKVIDNTTFRINLIEKDEKFIERLIFPILSQDKNIGTNKYKVKEITDEKIILESKDNGQVLNIFVYSNLEKMYEDFKNKKIDLIKSVENINYKNYIGEFGYQEKSYKSNECIYLDFNTSGYFRDSKLKEVVFASINSHEIISKVFNGNAYDIKDIPYDLDEVVKTLEEQNYIYRNNGWYFKEKILSFNILLNKNLLTNLEIAYIIKEQIEKVGIKIELIIVDDKEFNKKVKNKEYDILILNKENDSCIYNKFVNCILCRKLNILYSLNMSGKITPTNRSIFYNIDTWKKIIK